MNEDNGNDRNEGEELPGFNFGRQDEPILGANEGTAAAQTGGGSENYLQRIAQLERELQTQRVEAGRLRKAMEENKSLREENEKLKAASKDYLAMIPENLRDSVDPDQAKAFGAMVDAQLRAANEASMERERARDEENSRFRQEDFERRLEAARPGFMKSIRAGGDKYDPWMNWTRVYGASVRQAYAACDLEGLCDLVDTFLASIGVTPRGGASATATPRPVSVAGSSGYDGSRDSRTYTFAEYAAAVRDAGERFRAGKIDGKAYTEIMDSLNLARDEGRVEV